MITQVLKYFIFSLWPQKKYEAAFSNLIVSNCMVYSPDIAPQIIGYNLSIYKMGIQLWTVLCNRGCKEKNHPNCYKYATYEVSFFYIFMAKVLLFWNIVAYTLKSYIT